MAGAVFNEPLSTFTLEPLAIDRLEPFINVPCCRFNVVPEAKVVAALNVTPAVLFKVNVLKVVP